MECVLSPTVKVIVIYIVKMYYDIHIYIILKPGGNFSVLQNPTPDGRLNKYELTEIKQWLK